MLDFHQPERGLFIWPQVKDGSIALATAQPSMLLERIDWRAPVRTWCWKRFADPAIAKGFGARLNGSMRIADPGYDGAMSDAVAEIADFRAPLAARAAEQAKARAELTGARLPIAHYRAQLAKLRCLDPEAYLTGAIAAMTGGHLIDWLDTLLPWDWAPQVSRMAL